MTVATDAHAGLTCPLCRYDLRGLADPRCPECGFRFTWAELAEAGKNHGLFEHAIRRRGRAFWRTYWRTCRPRRFWREMTPASPVRPGRVVAYALLAAAMLMVVSAIPISAVAIRLLKDNVQMRAKSQPVSGRSGWYTVTTWFGSAQYPRAELDAQFPLPWMARFWRTVWLDISEMRVLGNRSTCHVTWAAMIAVVFGWPWLSWAALLVFQRSMRRAAIDPGHVLRVAVYGCDFGLILSLAIGTVVWWIAREYPYGTPSPRLWLDESPLHAATMMGSVLLGCVTLATYRMSIAYARYMRFDRPVATVVASQVMVLLVVVLMLLATGQLF